MLIIGTRLGMPAAPLCEHKEDPGPPGSPAPTSVHVGLQGLQWESAGDDLEPTLPFSLIQDKKDSPSDLHKEFSPKLCLPKPRFGKSRGDQSLTCKVPLPQSAADPTLGMHQEGQGRQREGKLWTDGG